MRRRSGVFCKFLFGIVCACFHGSCVLLKGLTLLPGGARSWIAQASRLADKLRWTVTVQKTGLLFDFVVKKRKVIIRYCAASVKGSVNDQRITNAGKSSLSETGSDGGELVKISQGVCTGPGGVGKTMEEKNLDDGIKVTGKAANDKARSSFPSCPAEQSRRVFDNFPLCSSFDLFCRRWRNKRGGPHFEGRPFLLSNSFCTFSTPVNAGISRTC